jgi:hypothetical protein
VFGCCCCCCFTTSSLHARLNIQDNRKSPS